MAATVKIKYFGWSALCIDDGRAPLYFDPFFRHYCGAQWFGPGDFADARYICVTHGHEEHFLDVPGLARDTGATVIGPQSAMRFLKWRRRLPVDNLVNLDADECVEVPGYRISAFKWKHRDINLPIALSRALFQGNATQLAWAWSSATRAPFYCPYTGYHVELPDGLTVMNYNEGFNSKMTDQEINELGDRFNTDVLLAGIQLNFIDDLVRGIQALRPKTVLLYPPHEKFHEMMGAVSAPWTEFEAAAQRALPQARIVLAKPGTVIDARSGQQLSDVTPAQSIAA